MKLEIPSLSQSWLFQESLGVKIRLASLKLHPSFGSVPSKVSLSSGTPSPSVSVVKTVKRIVLLQPFDWVYVIFVVPSFKGVTNPVELIVAIVVSEETQGVKTAGVPEPVN